MAKFKVGDRVNWTRVRGEFDGATIEAIKVDDAFFIWPYKLRATNGHCTFANTDELEPATLTIEAGKYYRTRDGRKVGPVVRHGGAGDYMFEVEFGFWVNSAGIRMRGDRSTDLIAEWVEPQAEPVPVAANDDKHTADGNAVTDVIVGKLTLKITDIEFDIPTVTHGRLVKTPRGYGYELARFDKWSFVDTGGSVPIVITSNKLAAA